jgi:CRISPR/Cas system-associated exonuclease Cas4 (RecB family)
MFVDKWNANKEHAEFLVAQANTADSFLANGLNEYFAKYKDDDLTYWPVKRSFAIPLNSDTYYVGEFDGVAMWEKTSKLVVVERKFTQQMPSNLVSRFQLDDQGRGYVWAARMLGFDVEGVLLDIVGCKKYPEVVRDYIPMDGRVMDEFIRDLEQTIEEITEATQKNRYPMSPHSCDARGECPYKMLCLNPDRAMFADSMGYKVKVVSHEEEVFDKSHADAT